jgi:hypothetical protein
VIAMLPALVVAGIGLVLLVVLAVVLRGRLRRFDAAAAKLRTGLADRLAALRTISAARPRRR